MTRLAVQLVLIVAVALGSPVAACCRLASMVGDGVGGLVRSDSGAHRCCVCCPEPGASPAEPRSHAPPKTCECGPAKNLFAGSHTSPKVMGMDAVLGGTPTPGALVLDRGAMPSIVLSDWWRPPPCSLVALHCALII